MSIIKTAGIFLINKKNEILLAHPTNHPKDFWSIPKGRRDEGEDSLTCAIRETYEEVNVDLRNVDFKYHKLEKQVFKNKRKMLRPFVVFESENSIDFSKFELKCNSNVEEEMGGFSEMDDFLFISINDIGVSINLHDTQMDCIEDIKKLITQLGF